MLVLVEFTRVAVAELAPANQSLRLGAFARDAGALGSASSLLQTRRQQLSRGRCVSDEEIAVRQAKLGRPGQVRPR